MFVREICVDSCGMEHLRHIDPDFPLMVFNNDIWRYYTHCVPWHWHDDCEIILMLEGEIEIGCNSSRISLSAGNGCFINRGALHEVKPKNDMPGKFFTIIFNPSVISDSPSSPIHSKCVMPIIKREDIDIVLFNGDAKNGKNIAAQILNTAELWESEEFTRELKMRTHISETWVGIIKEIGEMPKSTRKSSPPEIKAALNYIRENLGAELSPCIIAKEAGVSVSTLARRFKNCLGMSVMDYVTKYRVRTAAQKLCETGDNIIEICFTCGFNDPSYFTKVFRRVAGCTPKEYRISHAFV